MRRILKFVDIHDGMQESLQWLLRLFQMPLFLFVTLFGHVTIFIGAGAFYYFERGINPKNFEFLDAYYWAISIATTVGNSELIPVSDAGKWTGIFLMVFCSLFLWMYMALFAVSFVRREVRQVQRGMRELEHSVGEIEADVRLDHTAVSQLLLELRELRAELNKRK